MDVSAKARYLRISPIKAALVADLIRGLPVEKAQLQLKFSGKKAGKLIAKLLDSAIANATHNFDLASEELYVAEINVSRGPQLKRMRFVSRGRAVRILKATSHINLVLRSKPQKSASSLTAEPQSDKKRRADKVKVAKKVSRAPEKGKSKGVTD